MNGKVLRFALCVSLVMLALAPSAFASGQGAAILDARWKAAMLAGDLDKVMACYANGAILWMPGAPEAHGSEQIRAAYQAFFAANTVKDVTMSETNYRTSGIVSTGWGRFTKQGGAEVIMKGRFTEVAMRYKAKWVYVADHASADPAPAPAPKGK